MCSSTVVWWQPPKRRKPTATLTRNWCGCSLHEWGLLWHLFHLNLEKAFGSARVEEHAVSCDGCGMTQLKSNNWQGLTPCVFKNEFTNKTPVLLPKFQMQLWVHLSLPHLSLPHVWKTTKSKKCSTGFCGEKNLRLNQRNAGRILSNFGIQDPVHLWCSNVFEELLVQKGYLECKVWWKVKRPVKLFQVTRELKKNCTTIPYPPKRTLTIAAGTGAITRALFSSFMYLDNAMEGWNMYWHQLAFTWKTTRWNGQGTSRYSDEYPLSSASVGYPSRSCPWSGIRGTVGFPEKHRIARFLPRNNTGFETVPVSNASIPESTPRFPFRPLVPNIPHIDTRRPV